jgi:CubicO group peptidase (beta-lactamase class C family)
MRVEVPASKGEYGRGRLWLRGSDAGTPPGENPDIGFDLPDDAFWMLGHDGQSIAIIPSKQLVVMRLGLTPSKLGYKAQGLWKHWRRCGINPASVSPLARRSHDKAFGMKGLRRVHRVAIPALRAVNRAA